MQTTTTIHSQIKGLLKEYKDFPKEGILFEDLTPVYGDPEVFNNLIDFMVTKCNELEEFDYVIGIEARGFIAGAALAQKLGCGFIPVRKKGKLPGKLKSADYSLEYGTATVEIQEQECLKNSRVLIYDDVFATGGTMKAVMSLLTDNVKYMALGVIMDIKISDIKSLNVDSFVVMDENNG